jgi:hypothetical protein
MHTGSVLGTQHGILGVEQLKTGSILQRHSILAICQLPGYHGPGLYYYSEESAIRARFPCHFSFLLLTMHILIAYPIRYARRIDAC